MWSGGRVSRKGTCMRAYMHGAWTKFWHSRLEDNTFLHGNASTEATNT